MSLYGSLVFTKLEVYPFFSVAQQPNTCLCCLTVSVSRSHKIRHAYKMGLLRTSDQLIPEADPLYTHTHTHTHTHKTQEKNLHSLARILILDPSKESAVDTGVRTQGHRDWQFK